MKVTITYCSLWNYHPTAARVAGSILANFLDGVEVSLIRGKGGIFDVAVEDEVVYSKQKRGIQKSDIKDADVVQAVKEYVDKHKETAILAGVMKEKWDAMKEKAYL